MRTEHRVAEFHAWITEVSGPIQRMSRLPKIDATDREIRESQEAFKLLMRLDAAALACHAILLRSHWVDLLDRTCPDEAVAGDDREDGTARVDAGNDIADVLHDHSPVRAA